MLPETTVTPERAVTRLRDTAVLWAVATEEEQADLIAAVFAAHVVKGAEFIELRLTPEAYAHGFAVALLLGVAMARPTGFGRALATYEIPIEGRDEWLAAAGITA